MTKVGNIEVDPDHKWHRVFLTDDNGRPGRMASQDRLEVPARDLRAVATLLLALADEMEPNMPTGLLPDYSAVILLKEVREQDVVIPAGTRGVIVDTCPSHYIVEVFEPWETVVDVAHEDVDPTV